MDDDIVTKILKNYYGGIDSVIVRLGLANIERIEVMAQPPRGCLDQRWIICKDGQRLLFELKQPGA